MRILSDPRALLILRKRLPNTILRIGKVALQIYPSLNNRSLSLCCILGIIIVVSHLIFSLLRRPRRPRRPRRRNSCFKIRNLPSTRAKCCICLILLLLSLDPRSSLSKAHPLHSWYSCDHLSSMRGGWEVSRCVPVRLGSVLQIGSPNEALRLDLYHFFPCV